MTALTELAASSKTEDAKPIFPSHLEKLKDTTLVAQGSQTEQTSNLSHNELAEQDYSY